MEGIRDGFVGDDCFVCGWLVARRAAVPALPRPRSSVARGAHDGRRAWSRSASLRALGRVGGRAAIVEALAALLSRWCTSTCEAVARGAGRSWALDRRDLAPGLAPRRTRRSARRLSVTPGRRRSAPRAADAIDSLGGAAVCMARCRCRRLALCARPPRSRAAAATTRPAAPDVFFDLDGELAGRTFFERAVPVGRAGRRRRHPGVRRVPQRQRRHPDPSATCGPRPTGKRRRAARCRWRSSGSRRRPLPFQRRRR
jgi:hypothetical protein